MPDPEEINPHIPRMAQVAESYNDILQHNSKHTGFGAMFGAVLEGALDDAIVSDEATEVTDIYDAIDSKLQDKVVEGDMSAELQDMFHGDLFSRVGLKMLPSGSYVADGKGKKATSEGLEPFIDNTELFAEFLRTVSPDDVHQEAGSKLLLDVAVSTKRIIGETIGDPEKLIELPEAEQGLLREIGESALRTWDLLADEYKRLGFSAGLIRVRLTDNPDDSATKRELHIFGGLEQYVDYWSKELLPEFIEAWDEGYLTPAEEYYYWHPSRWAEDMLPDELADRWEKAMDFITDLKTKGSAAELATVVQSNLGTSLEESRQRMASRETEAEAHYKEELKEWKAHGEQNYKKIDENGHTFTVRSPNEAAPAYYRNNRVALEAAKLRFQQL